MTEVARPSSGRIVNTTVRIQAAMVYLVSLFLKKILAKRLHAGGIPEDEIPPAQGLQAQDL